MEVTPNKFEGIVSEKRNNVPGAPYDAGRAELRELSLRNQEGEPVCLTRQQAELIWEQFVETARIRNWTIVTCSIMYNHVHMMTGVEADPNPEDILRDFKKWASIRLSRHFPVPPSGKWWTQSGSKRKIDSENSYIRCYEYIQNQANPIFVR